MQDTQALVGALDKVILEATSAKEALLAGKPTRVYGVVADACKIDNEMILREIKAKLRVVDQIEIDWEYEHCDDGRYARHITAILMTAASRTIVLYDSEPEDEELDEFAEFLGAIRTEDAGEIALDLWSLCDDIASSGCDESAFNLA